MINCELITVPKGIGFISQWNDFDINSLTFPHVMNKKITGCGFTEYFLRNPYNVILCSPRRMLLENKLDQHSDDIYYFRNDLEISADYEKGVDKADKAKLAAVTLTPFTESKYLQKQKARQAAIKIHVDALKKGLIEYVDRCIACNKPCKILVTYDSFKYIRETLDNIISNFIIAVDEFQSIFVDSRYKADTELSFLKYLNGIDKVCFMSATPMLEKYMNMVDEFKNIKYYELDWETEDPKRVARPTLDYKFCTRSVLEEAYKVIETYKNLGHDTEFLVNTDSQGNLQKIYSTEAVLFLNSVTSICTIIKHFGLKPEETNVLCAKTEENEKKLRKAFGMTKRKLPEPIGKIPGYEKPHKMFTFCTRTVYLGADFYSKCAKTFIFSDTNYETLAVDILLDLDQILGRQRLGENPWRNRATIFIRTTDNLRDQDSFNKWVDKKKKTTNRLINIYSRLQDDVERDDIAGKYERDIYGTKYKKDYVSIHKQVGAVPIPVFNNLVLVSELRAFEVQNIEYASQFVVKSSLDKNYSTQIYDPSISSTEFRTLKETFNSLSVFRDKMMFLRSVQINSRPELFESLLNSVPLNFKNYFTYLTPSEISSANYVEHELKNLIDAKVNNQVNSSTVTGEILSTFKVGERYENSWIKNKLLEIYTKHNYRIGCRANIVAKSVDLEVWFDIEPVYCTNKVTKKRVRGCKILGTK